MLQIPMDTPAQDRTENLLLRRQAPYPLGHGGSCVVLAVAVGGNVNGGNVPPLCDSAQSEWLVPAQRLRAAHNYVSGPNLKKDENRTLWFTTKVVEVGVKKIYEKKLPPPRFELGTSRLLSVRSNQLSYGGAFCVAPVDHKANKNIWLGSWRTQSSKKHCLHSGSNRGSFACEANGLTNFPMETTRTG